MNSPDTNEENTVTDPKCNADSRDDISKGIEQVFLDSTPRIPTIPTITMKTFFDLPGEVRNKIYRFTTFRTTPYPIYYDLDSKSALSSFQWRYQLPNIALVCKDAIEEVRSIHIGENVFELFDMSRTTLGNGQTACVLLDKLLEKGEKKKNIKELRHVTVKYRDGGVAPVVLHADLTGNDNNRVLSARITSQATQKFDGEEHTIDVEGCIAHLQNYLHDFKVGGEPTDGRALLRLAKVFCQRYFNAVFGDEERCKREGCKGRVICRIGRVGGGRFWGEDGGGVACEI